MNKTVLAVLAALVGLVVVVGLLLAGQFNRFVRLGQAADSQWAQVQNVYQRRADLIPNLVNTVSGAANFEKSTLTEVVQARASAGSVQLNANAAPSEEELGRFQQAQDRLSSALSRLLVVVERYPDLKANANFQTLQAQLEGTENRISVERGRFNDTVRAYNTAVGSFPGVMLAGMFGHKPKAYFRATEGAETPPKVDFNFGKQPNNSAPAAQ